MRHTCSTCGYCKSGALLSEVSNGREDPCETCEAITVNEFTNWHPIPITNADRIRAMSDEEMASLFGVWVADCDNNDVPCKEYCSYYKSCGDAWLAWLKEEVKDG